MMCLWIDSPGSRNTSSFRAAFARVLTDPVKLVMIAGNGEETAAYELDLDKLMYIAHERQCQDHVRYQEHQGKPDDQFAVSLGSVHILLTDFSNSSV